MPPPSACYMSEEISPGESILPRQLRRDSLLPRTNGVSLRGLVRELGMKSAVLQEFPDDAVQHRATARVTPDARQAASAMRALLSGLPPECSEAAEWELTRTLRRLYGTRPPRWLRHLAPCGRGNA